MCHMVKVILLCVFLTLFNLQPTFWFLVCDFILFLLREVYAGIVLWFYFENLILIDTPLI